MKTVISLAASLLVLSFVSGSAFAALGGFIPCNNHSHGPAMPCAPK